MHTAKEGLHKTGRRASADRTLKHLYTRDSGSLSQSRGGWERGEGSPIAAACPGSSSATLLSLAGPCP